MISPRPCRQDVTASYDRGAVSYDELWSPVILPAARALAGVLCRGGERLVIDVGGGTGALLPAIRSAAPAARVVTLDASAAMLRLARARRGAAAVLADAAALPVADRAADVVILAYVLFHLADPQAAVGEAARVLRPGGRAGSVTWAAERACRAQALWVEILDAAGVPQVPARRSDTGLDSAAALAALYRTARLTMEHAWAVTLRRQWDRASFWALVTGNGVNQLRLGMADARARAGALRRAERELSRLEPADYRWEGDVICAVATKPARVR